MESLFQEGDQGPKVLDLCNLLLILDKVNISSEHDRRIWLGDGSGIYNCASFYSYLTQPNKSTHPFSYSPTYLEAKIPQKGTMKIQNFGVRIWLGKAICLRQGDSCRGLLISPWLLLSHCSYSDTSGKKSKATPLQERRMIDQFRLHVKGGDGGNGSSSLHRGRSDRHGKPDGGNGGRGGDVILQCTSSVWDFRGLQHHINGGRGGHGTSKNKIGSRGEDKVVQVPVGTVIHLLEGEISSIVAKPSSEHTYPWEAPGAVTSNFCGPDQPSNSNLHEEKVDLVEAVAHDSFSCTSGTTAELADIGPHFRLSTIHSHFSGNLSCRGSTNREKEFASDYHNDNDCRSTEGDDWRTENDSGMSEEDSEDIDGIQCNVAELTEEGQQIIVAHGGEGGFGSLSSGRHSKKNSRDINHHFGRIDNFEGSIDESQSNIKIGLPGSQAFLILELKSIADVGLVGMPNAGKSTLLGAISRAKPVVGHYAFTTLRPNIGKLNYDESSVTVADIPGLIKGAHENRGLGHAFLRHIERTKILAYVVDLAAALNGRKGVTPWEQLKDLVSELEHYREGLSDRPSLVVANKIDEVGAEGVLDELQRRVCGIPIYPICAILEEGIPELKAGLKQLVDGGESTILRLDNILID